MTLIEGFGDEVTIFAVIALLSLLILSICYLSRAFVDTSVNQQISDSEGGELQDQRQTVNNVVTERNATIQENSSNMGNLDPNREKTSAEDELGNELQRDGGASNNNDKADDTQLRKDGGNLTEPSCKTQGQQLSNTDSAKSLPQRNNVVREELESSRPNGRIGVDDLDTSERSHPNQITIRIKYLNDTERTINTQLNEKIVDFKRKYFAEELSANQTVRLIFNGQLLRNEVSLQYYGISDGCVVHVHISQNEPQQPQSTMDSNVDLDLSHLLWPLFSVIIVVFWVLYFNYPEFFSMISTGILVVLTGAFILLYSHGGLQLQNQQL